MLGNDELIALCVTLATEGETLGYTRNNTMVWKQSKRQLKTRGPRGPWVAHLRKRSKVTVEPIIENTRGII